MGHNIPGIINHINLFRIFVDRGNDLVDIIAGTGLPETFAERQFLPLCVKQHHLMLVKKL